MCRSATLAFSVGAEAITLPGLAARVPKMTYIRLTLFELKRSKEDQIVKLPVGIL
jgi:hypothetical protein